MQQEHDDIVYRLQQHLEYKGFKDIHTFEEYRKHGVVGEIDLYVPLDKYVLLFEVKEHDSIRAFNKAVRQMHRAEYTLFQGKRVFEFYVHGYNGDYYIQWVKHHS